MSFLFNASALLARIRSNETKDAEFNFVSVSGKEISHKGNIITTHMIKTMIDDLMSRYLHELRNQAFFQEDIPSDLFPSFKLESLVDNLQNLAPGYCFLNDPRNGFDDYRNVYGKWLLSDPIRASKFSYVHNGCLAWNPKECEHLLESFQKCRTLLQIGIILSGGPSARGSESSRHILRELPGAPRNLRVLFKVVCLVDIQDKTAHKSLKDKYVPHVPTREWTTALINYLVVIRPFEEYLVGQLFPPESPVTTRYRHQLWPGLQHAVTSTDLSSTMALITEKYLNKPYKITWWRGLVTHFSSQFQDKFLFEVHKEYYADTANMHSTDMGVKHYSPLESNLDGSDTRTIVGCLRVGVAWHKLVEIGQTDPIKLEDIDDAESSGLNNTPGISCGTGHFYPCVAGLTTEWTEHASITSDTINQITTTIASNLETNLKASVTDIMRESFAEMATMYFPKPPITSNGANLRSLTDLAVHPSRLRDLRRFLNNPSANFTTPEQAILLEHILSSEQDILGILGTGVGKTTLILMLAKMYAKGKTLLVILPLSSLYLDLKRRANEAGLSITQWMPTGDKVNPNAHIICCAIEYLTFGTFLEFFKTLHQQGRLFRVICDEVQKIITDVVFRPAFQFFSLLNTVDSRLVGFTASLPPHLMATFNRLTGKVWQVIRMPSNRKEFKYSVIKLAQGSETPAEHAIEYISGILESYGPEDRGMVFCRSINAANLLATKLGTSACHSKKNPAEMEATIEQWRHGSIQFLVSTSLLGCGFDYPSVRDVIHVGLAHSVLDQYQEDSRGGRDGKECRVVTIIPARLQEPEVTRGGDSCDTGVKEVYEWATKPQCLRIIPSHFIDGVAITCPILQDAVLCSYCAEESICPVPARPATMPEPYSSFANRDHVVRPDWYLQHTNPAPLSYSTPAGARSDIQGHRPPPSTNPPQNPQVPFVFRPPPSTRQPHGSPALSAASHVPMVPIYISLRLIR
ncbi:hypothetical protein B0H34DRAFT_800655 [Crassisporium funariophilum]|nr:hypothetical protein B0H34DRAFT_800655 [Crassisporium funariophilum]